MRTIEFGYLPKTFNASNEKIEVSDKPNLEEIKESITISAEECSQYDFVIVGGNAYPKHQNRRLFSLPFTHDIVDKSQNQTSYHKAFVWFLSFAQGIRLQQAQNGFLDFAYTQTEKISSFRLDASPQETLDHFDRVFMGFQHKDQTQLHTAIHCLQLSANIELFEYESFFYLYTAIEALCKFHQLNNGLHSKRLKTLCSTLGINDPTNDISTHCGVDIIKQRNTLIHEGAYANDTIGYSTHYDPNFLRVFKDFISRLIAATYAIGTQDYLNQNIFDRSIKRATI